MLVKLGICSLVTVVLGVTLAVGIMKVGVHLSVYENYNRLVDLLGAEEISVKYDYGGVKRKCTTQTGAISWIISSKECTEEVTKPKATFRGSADQVAKLLKSINMRGVDYQIEDADESSRQRQKQRRLM